MLQKILSITGRPGLYRLVNQGKNCLIVESVDARKHRMPVFNHEKVMSLGDIAMYTTGEEKPLGEVFELVKEKFGGKPVDIKDIEKKNALRETFAEILPDFDDERVKNSDIKKLLTWYNILVNDGVTEFKDVEQEQEEGQEEEKETK